MKNQLKRTDVIRVDENQLTFMGHGKYVGEEFNYRGKPFTGFVIIDYHENGNILLEQEYVKGQVFGWEVIYHENGALKEETLMAGATSVVYREFSEDGTLLEEGWLESKAFYNKVAEETGMDKIPEDE